MSVFETEMVSLIGGRRDDDDDSSRGDNDNDFDDDGNSNSYNDDDDGNDGSDDDSSSSSSSSSNYCRTFGARCLVLVALLLSLFVYAGKQTSARHHRQPPSSSYITSINDTVVVVDEKNVSEDGGRHPAPSSSAEEPSSAVSTTASSSSLSSVNGTVVGMAVDEHNFSEVEVHDADGTDESDDSLLKPDLWISGVSWHEGISKWHISFAHVLALAKSLDAVLVEPAIKGARLVRCDQPHAVSLFTVYNRALILDYYPRIASCQQYQDARTKSAATTASSSKTKQSAIEQQPLAPPPKVFHMCLDKSDKHNTCDNGNNSGSCRCDRSNSTRSSSCHGLQECPSLSEAIEYSWNNPHAMTIVEIRNMWYTSLSPKLVVSHAGVVGTTPLLPPPEELTALREQHFQFVTSLYDLLDTALLRANVTPENGNFGVVHWRAEKNHIDYMKCAQEIVAASQAMELPHGTPFFIMSSFSEESSHSWEGSKIMAAKSNTDDTTANAEMALGFLLDDDGFLKLDRLLPGLDDAVYYVVLDLLLAEKAASFATCQNSCLRPYRSCQRCNYVGTFAKYALERRRSYRRRRGSRHNGTNTTPDTGTLPCWPTSSSELEGISKLLPG